MNSSAGRQGPARTSTATVGPERARTASRCPTSECRLATSSAEKRPDACPMSRLLGPSAAIYRERNFTRLPAGFTSWPKPRNLDTRSPRVCSYRPFAIEPCSERARWDRSTAGPGGTLGTPAKLPAQFLDVRDAQVDAAGLIGAFALPWETGPAREEP